MNQQQLLVRLWSLYKSVRKVIFANAESNKVSKACGELRETAESGILVPEHSEKLIQCVVSIEECGPTSETKADLENWYMGNFGRYLLTIIKGWRSQVIIFVVISFVLSLLMCLDYVLKFHTLPESIIIPVISCLFLTSICMWLLTDLLSKKHKQLLRKHLGEDCFSKK